MKLMNVEKLDWAYEIEEALKGQKNWPFDGTGTFFVIYKDRWTEAVYKEFWTGAELKNMMTDDGVAQIKFIEIDWVFEKTYSTNNRVKYYM